MKTKTCRAVLSTLMSVSVMSAAATDFSTLAPFDGIVAAYEQAVTEKWGDELTAEQTALVEYHQLNMPFIRDVSRSGVPTLGYCLADLDGDGTTELLLGDMTDNMIYSVHAVTDGMLLCILEGWDRSAYYLHGDIIVRTASSGAGDSAVELYRYDGHVLSMDGALEYEDETGWSCMMYGETSAITDEQANDLISSLTPDPLPWKAVIDRHLGYLARRSSTSKREKSVYLYYDDQPSKRMKKLADGQMVTVLSEEGQRTRVSTLGTDSVTGYVFTEDLTMLPTPIGAGKLTANNTGDINIRLTPNGNDTRVAAKKRGTEIVIYNHENGWYEVSVGDIHGFVMERFVAPD